MTKDQLLKITKNLNYDIVSELFEKYKINTSFREAMFLAQCSHESGDFKAKKENLNYSADMLKKVFPKYFKHVDINLYARNPEKIANRVYANRMGNEDESSGDGWKYRGRGYIQLTGKNNYISFSQYINKSIDETIKYIETDKGALESALFFWQRENLNELADAENIIACTKRINGGINGLADREAKYNKFLKILES